MKINNKIITNPLNQPIMQKLLEAILNAHQKNYSDTVEIQTLANTNIESDDESSMQTLVISFKVPKDLLYPEPNIISDEALNKEIQASEDAEAIAKGYLKEYIKDCLKLYPGDCLKENTDIPGLTQISGIGSNLLYQATILVTDHTLYITLYQTGQW